MSMEIFPPPVFSERIYLGMLFIFSYMIYMVESTIKTIWASGFLAEKILIMKPISFIDLWLFRFSIFCCTSFGKLYFSGIY